MRASRRGLIDVRRFAVVSDLLARTVELIGEAGDAGDERMVVWGATATGPGTLRCRSLYLPAQVSIRTPEGLAVMIEGGALRELNAALNGRGEVLAVQVHAHPDDAYHSPTDDRLAVATTLGALSLVIPNFARDGVAGIADWSCHRLGADGWNRVALDEVLSIE